jgi:hypothetical protein
MRTAAEELLGGFQNFHSINGTAEVSGLAASSARFVTAGQAFHWFDPVAARKEFDRIIIPNGFAALVWNERRLGESAFSDEYEKLIEKYRTDHSVQRIRNLAQTEEGALGSFFGPAGFQKRTFDNPQWLDRQGLIDRLLSSSYMPTPSDPVYNELITAANAVFDAHQTGAKVEVAHNTYVYFAKLSG